jgi:hypothetical protein
MRLALENVHLRPIHTYHAVPLPLPCHSHWPLQFEIGMLGVVAFKLASLCAVNYTSTQRPCTKIISFSLSITNAALFHTGHMATAIWDWYASDNKLPGTGRGSNKGHKLASHKHAVNMPSPCHQHAITTLPWPWEVTYRKAHLWHGRGTAWHVWIKHSRTM